MLEKRSYKKELLDGDSIPFADIQQNMKELNFINTWLGGHTITINAFQRFLNNRKTISICEIGCGGGDNLLAIYRWCTKRGVTVTITGIDIKAECIAFAKSRKRFPTSATWITSDYQRVQFNEKPDIIFSSLFCHHFTNEELVFQLKWMKQNSAAGFFINDLQRNTLAYFLIKGLTHVFSRSYLVKNDAPLSVARGFSKHELKFICAEAGIAGASISWKWAFRYVLIYDHAK
jgi:2-polyprenyl-3-methyl-5-hydroxy-6-metoxy-1,4-benzoquinol methylase